MDATSRRATLPGALALAILILWSWAAPSARAAEPDWALVAESIGEAGYYVDSNAKYFRTDPALDQLRGAQDKSTPVFIAVFPTSIRPATAITQLKSALNRRGTYVVLAGDQLRVSSTALPKATVQRAYNQAVTANKGKPAQALVAFVQKLDERKVGNQVIGRPKTPTPKAGKGKKARPTPTAAVPQPGAPLPGSAQQAAQQQESDDSGGSGILPIAVGAVVVLAVAGAGGFFILRRRSSGS